MWNDITAYILMGHESKRTVYECVQKWSQLSSRFIFYIYTCPNWYFEQRNAFRTYRNLRNPTWRNAIILKQLLRLILGKLVHYVVTIHLLHIYNYYSVSFYSFSDISSLMRYLMQARFLLLVIFFFQTVFLLIFFAKNFLLIIFLTKFYCWYRNLFLQVVTPV